MTKYMDMIPGDYSRAPQDHDVARAEGFEQDYRESEEQRKALQTYTDRFASIAMALDDRPADRRQLLNELDTCATNYYRDKIAGRFGR